MIEQRTDEWHEQRRGRFTASDIHKLLGAKGLGLTGEDLAFKKACEMVFGRDPDEEFTSFDMQRGISLEPLAFDLFKSLKELEFINVQKAAFFPYGKNAGASPDGLVDSDGVLEMKCTRSLKLFRLIADGIEKIDPEYISQMQMQMLATNSDKAFFFVYVQFKGFEYYHEIVVPRNETHIELIKDRIEMATEIRDMYIDKLFRNAQFDLPI